MKHQYTNNIYSVTSTTKSDTILFVHGFQGSFKDNLNYVSYFEEKGIQSFSINFEGLNVPSQVEQLESLIRFVSSLDTINRLYLFAESQGGLVSLLANKDGINGLILLYPACNLPDLARERYSTKEEIDERFLLFDYEVDRTYFQSIYDLDVFSSMKNRDIPTLILHGSMDELVPYRYSEALVKHLGNALLVCIENQGHGFYIPFSNETIAPIVESFLKEKCAI